MNLTVSTNSIKFKNRLKKFMVSEVRTVVITEKERRSRDWKEVRETLLLVKIYFLTRVMVSWV